MVDVVSFVGSVTGGGTGATGVTLDLSGLGMQYGDVVYAISSTVDNQTTSVTTSGYTSIYNAVAPGSAPNVYIRVARKMMGAVPDTSVAFTGTGGATFGMTAIAYVFRVVDTTAFEDATTTTANGNSTTPDSPSITTVTNNAAVMSIAASHVLDSTVTLPTGYSNQANVASTNTTVNNSMGVAWKSIATAGAENPGTWTNFTFNTWQALSVAVRPGQPPSLFTPQSMLLGVG